MAANFQNFIIEPPLVQESAGLVRLGQTMQQNKEWDYRLQKEREADQWKKLALIKDVTDLSQHQTGSDVANAIGNKLASSVIQKYTANVDKMSGPELMANLEKDMSGVVSGMEGTKNELLQAEKEIVGIKQLYPNVDTGSLYAKVREDIVHRRLDEKGSTFRNQMDVPPPQYDLSDPELLSEFVTGDKNLRAYFQNPQGLDQTDIFTGTPTNYIKYSAKIPSWKKLAFNQEDVQGGFLKKGEPKLSFKSVTLPTESMPSSQGKPFEMIDKDVFDQLGGQEKLELIAATKKKFLDYNKLNPTEKEYALRHTYLQTAKALDQLDFHPTDIKTPSASMLKLQMGIGGSSRTQAEPIDLRDPIYKDVDGGKDITPLMQGVKVTGLATGQSLLARKVIFNPKTKMVTYQEYTDHPDEQKNYPEKTVNLTTFMQNIRTNNPGIDMKFLEGLWNPITDDNKPSGKQPAQRTQTKKDPLGILD